MSAPAIPDTRAAKPRLDGFRVTPWVHHCGRFVARHPRLWIRLANFETRVRAADIADREIVKPVFVCGLARAGTTILLETLAGHPELGSHRYRDDPFVFPPMLWDAFLARLPNERTPQADRAHDAGHVGTPDGPEAFAELPSRADEPRVRKEGGR